MRALYVRGGWIAAALILTVLCAPDAEQASAKEWEDPKVNIGVIIPDNPFPWEWTPATKSWKRFGIVKGARRELAKRKDGKTPEGEGGMMHVAVRDAPKETPLEELATDEDLRGFLLKRFSKKGEVEVEDWEDPKGVKGKLLRVDGESKNLRGKEAACRGVLIICLHSQKVYLLRLYAWHTPLDQEGLKDDLDWMEVEGGLYFIDAREKGPAQPPPGVGNGGGEGEEPTDPDAKDEWIQNVAQKFEVFKPARITEVDIKEGQDHQILCFEGNHEKGFYGIYMYAIPNSRVIDGQQAPAENIKKAITTDWWKNFNTNHPAPAEVFTFKWPKKLASKRRTWITLPDLTDENKVLLFGKKKKRPIKPSQTEIIKKFKIVEKVKKNQINSDKGGEAMRGVLQAMRPRVGNETVLRYVWRSPTHSYRLIVSITRQGYEHWGADVRRLLESITFDKKIGTKRYKRK